MHKFDTSVPHFFSRVRGMRIVVTPDIVSEVLHVPRVAHPDYPSYNRLRTMSKDELSSLFCETSLSWGDSQNTPWSGFAKGLRFLNIVMTFILHPLYHYNSIIEPRARFLSSLLEDISINFPSHFILSLINVYRNTVTHDKLIFPFCYHEAFSQFFYLLSRVSSFHGYECHRRCYRSTERGTAQTEVAPNRNGDSSSFYHSIHLCSFIFCGWSDSQGHHGIACAHGCSPWHTQWWVVSSEHLCWSYRMTTGYHGWFHYLYLSISTGFIGWKWWWLRQWWCRWGRGC